MFKLLSLYHNAWGGCFCYVIKMTIIILFTQLPFTVVGSVTAGAVYALNILYPLDQHHVVAMVTTCVIVINDMHQWILRSSGEEVLFVIDI